MSSNRSSRQVGALQVESLRYQRTATTPTAGILAIDSAGGVVPTTNIALGSLSITGAGSFGTLISSNAVLSRVSSGDITTTALNATNLNGDKVIAKEMAITEKLVLPTIIEQPIGTTVICAPQILAGTLYNEPFLSYFQLDVSGSARVNNLVVKDSITLPTDIRVDELNASELSAYRFVAGTNTFPSDEFHSMDVRGTARFAGAAKFQRYATFEAGLSASGITVQNLYAANLNANALTVPALNAETISVSQGAVFAGNGISASSAIVGGGLTAGTGSFSSLGATTATVSSLVAAGASLSTLTAATAQIGALDAEIVAGTTLRAGAGSFTTLGATTATIGSLNISSLSVDSITLPGSISATSGQFGSLGTTGLYVGGGLTAGSVYAPLVAGSTGTFRFLGATAAMIDSLQTSSLVIESIGLPGGISAASGQFGSLRSGTGTFGAALVGGLTAGSVYAPAVVGSTGTFGFLGATAAMIDSLQTTSLSVSSIALPGGISAATGQFGSLSSGAGTFGAALIGGGLTAGTGSFNTVDATNATVTTASIATLDVSGDITATTGQFQALDVSGAGTFGSVHVQGGMTASSGSFITLGATIASVDRLNAAAAIISSLSVSGELTAVSGQFQALDVSGSGTFRTVSAAAASIGSLSVSGGITASTGQFSTLGATGVGTFGAISVGGGITSSALNVSGVGQFSGVTATTATITNYLYAAGATVQGGVLTLPSIEVDDIIVNGSLIPGIGAYIELPKSIHRYIFGQQIVAGTTKDLSLLLGNYALDVSGTALFEGDVFMKAGLTVAGVVVGEAGQFQELGVSGTGSFGAVVSGGISASIGQFGTLGTTGTGSFGTIAVAGGLTASTGQFGTVGVTGTGSFGIVSATTGQFQSMGVTGTGAFGAVAVAGGLTAGTGQFQSMGVTGTGSFGAVAVAGGLTASTGQFNTMGVAGAVSMGSANITGSLVAGAAQVLSLGVTGSASIGGNLTTTGLGRFGNMDVDNVFNAQDIYANGLVSALNVSATSASFQNITIAGTQTFTSIAATGTVSGSAGQFNTLTVGSGVSAATGTFSGTGSFGSVVSAGGVSAASGQFQTLSAVGGITGSSAVFTGGLTAVSGQFQTLGVTGAGTFGSVVVGGGGQFQTLGVTGAGTFGSVAVGGGGQFQTLGVTGTGTFNGVVATNGITVSTDNKGIVFTAGTTPSRIVQAGNVTYIQDSNLIRFTAYNAPTTSTVVSVNGNLGVNTITPSYSLDVAGSARVSAGLTISSTSPTKYTLDIYNDQATLNSMYTSPPPVAQIQLQSGGNNSTNGRFLIGSYFTPLVGAAAMMQSYDGASVRPIYINPHGGFVGVGTTTPAYTLDVKGSAQFTNGLFSTSANVSGVVSAGTLTTTGAVSAASGSFTGNVNVSGAGSFNRVSVTAGITADTISSRNINVVPANGLNIIDTTNVRTMSSYGSVAFPGTTYVGVYTFGNSTLDPSFPLTNQSLEIVAAGTTQPIAALQLTAWDDVGSRNYIAMQCIGKGTNGFGNTMRDAYRAYRYAYPTSANGGGAIRVESISLKNGTATGAADQNEVPGDIGFWNGVQIKGNTFIKGNLNAAGGISATTGQFTGTLTAPNSSISGTATSGSISTNNISAAAGSFTGNVTVGGSLNSYSGFSTWTNISIPQSFPGSVIKMGNLVIQSCTDFLMQDSETVVWPVPLTTILSVSITCLVPDTATVIPTAAPLSGTLSPTGFNVAVYDYLAGTSWLICAIGLA